jgi:5-methylthioadenosine/S-adenosylhomocysteine deaminase
MSNPGKGPAAVDLLIKGADVVTMDEEDRVVRNGAVAVDKGRIVWIGKAGDAASLFNARETIDGSEQLVMPGMIDAHFHTAQHLLRGKLSEISRTRAPKMPVWKHYYLPFEAMLEPEDVHLSALAAYTNMLRVGTTCFAEAGGPHPDAMGRAADEVGIRGFIAQSTVDTGMGVPDGLMLKTDDAYEKNVSLVKRWSKHERVKAFLSLRQIVVCTPELTKAIGRAAEELDVKIHTHLCEGIYEIDFALERFGKRPTEYLEEMGILSHRLHCAHSIFLSPEEVDLYAKYRLSACHCGLHNYSVGKPRVLEMWRRGIDIGLGTDGAASSATLDLFQVAHAARIGQQLVAGTPWHMRTAISSDELLKIATHGGARALGMGKELGCLKPGYKADLILIDATDIDQQPIYDPLFTVSTTTVGRDVRSVVVDGRLVMKDREILTVDVEDIKARLAKRRPEIMEKFERLVA